MRALFRPWLTLLTHGPCPRLRQPSPLARYRDRGAGRPGRYIRNAHAVGKPAFGVTAGVDPADEPGRAGARPASVRAVPGRPPERCPADEQRADPERERHVEEA